MRFAAIGLVIGAMVCACPAEASDVASLQARADAGDVIAERDLGLAYRRGQVGPVDAQKAAIWLRKAAAERDVEAQYQLGSMLMGEYGIEADRQQGFDWLIRAAKVRSGKAEMALYNFYQSRAGEPGAQEKADTFHQSGERDLAKAARAGDLDAQMAMCTVTAVAGGADGVDSASPAASFDTYKACNEKARAGYLKLAQAGDEEAAAIAGANLEIWNLGQPAGVEGREGRLLVKQAADAGVVPAMNAAAQSDLLEGPDRNPAEALVYLNRAAGQHSLSAMMRLAGMYLNGDGVPKDVSQGLAWFRKAAEAGSDQAQFMLGILYSDHYGEHTLPIDMEQALTWYGLSARQGNVAAQLHLSILNYEGKHVPLDKATAYAWQLVINDFVNARNTAAVMTLTSMRSDFSRIQNIENDLTAEEKTCAEAIARGLRKELN